MKGYKLGFDEIKHETDSAYLIMFEPGIEVWLPKSQCTMMNNGEYVTCPEWLVEEKEIEIYEV